MFEPGAAVQQHSQQPAPPSAATVFEPLADPALSVPPPPAPPPGPAPAPPQRQAAPAEVLRTLERRLGELGVAPAAYRLQEAAEGCWCMVYEDDRWLVFRLAYGVRHKESAFDAIDQAAAYLLGSLLFVPAAAEEPQPIEPFDGEPPLSLFRNRQEIELAAGTVVDRYGAPTGNVTYAVRTPFPERSLPPEWERDPHHSYRLQRPCRVLTGIAVPWFGQPGGGTAYIFARPIIDLLNDGTLTSA